MPLAFNAAPLTDTSKEGLGAPTLKEYLGHVRMVPMVTKEHITHEFGNDEAWICICGNKPASDGFYSCDENGNEVEPTVADWKTDWYVCARCGRMIDFDTIEIVGRNEHATFLA